MKVVKQKTTLHVDNHDLNVDKSYKHGLLLPSTIRCIIVGPSNCGKTNIMISLIEHENGLKFENIYIWSTSLYQQKYIYLKKLLKPMKGIGFYTFDNNEEILEPSQAKRNSIFIFDDIACKKQEIIREYFSMGRHNHIDCFYLCQTYAKIPKHLIRDNANMLILFKQDEQNLRHIYNDHVGTDMNYDKFKEICAFCWKNTYGFLSIFKDDNLDNGRYRKGFDEFIVL